MCSIPLHSSPAAFHASSTFKIMCKNFFQMTCIVHSAQKPANLLQIALVRARQISRYSNRGLVPFSIKLVIADILVEMTMPFCGKAFPYKKNVSDTRRYAHSALSIFFHYSKLFVTLFDRWNIDARYIVGSNYSSLILFHTSIPYISFWLKTLPSLFIV